MNHKFLPLLIMVLLQMSSAYGQSVSIGSTTTSNAGLSITPPANSSGRNMIFRSEGDVDRFEIRTDGNSWVLANANDGANFIGAVIGFGTYVYTDFFVTGCQKLRIMDHPLDPANKTLQHSCLEGPEVLNVYSGSVTLDENGEAIVNLPDYFEAINKDYRYQLTAIGGAAPSLHIAEEIADNTFKVGGGVAGMKISWEVMGVRNDPYFRDNPYQVVKEKTAAQKGKYFYPQGYGQSVDKIYIQIGHY